MRFADIRAGLFPDDMDEETKQRLIDVTTPAREPKEKCTPVLNRAARRRLRKGFKIRAAK